MVDVAPTILDLSDLPAPVEMWGRSLAPVFSAEVEESARLLPLDLALGRPDPAQPRAPMRGAHAGDFKVIQERPGAAPFAIDLARDPHELRAGASERERANGGDDPRVSAAVALWSELARARHGRPSEHGELPDELRAELEKAGYIGGE